LGVIGEIDQKDFGDLFQVVLDTVLDDVIDRDDQLVELVQTLVDVLQVGVDVHGSPCEGDHSWSELKLEIFEMWLKEILGDGLDLAKDFFVLVKDVLELVKVHLELFLLKEDDSGGLWDLDVLSLEALGFTDQLQNSNIEVDVK
jgi:hypothetical protein